MSDAAFSYTGLFVLQALARGYRLGFDIMEVTGPAQRRDLSGATTPSLALVRYDWDDEQPGAQPGIVATPVLRADGRRQATADGV